MRHIAPRVSVIMPVRNAARFLDQSTGSVLRQSMPELELLVIDDGSTDGSVERVNRFAKQDDRVRLLDTAGNQGAAEARNRGLSQCRGRYVAFLDADDCWLEGKLQRQLAFMNDRDAYFCYTAYEKINSDGERFSRHVSVPSRLDHAGLLKGCPIGCSTVMVDTARTGTLKMPLMRRSQDYALWLKLVRRYGPATGLNEALTLYREYGGSLSANKFSKLKAAWLIYRQQEGLSRRRSATNLAAYVSHGFRKRLI